MDAINTRNPNNTIDTENTKDGIHTKDARKTQNYNKSIAFIENTLSFNSSLQLMI